MSDTKALETSLVFGLDIGTRNVVGTVGYKIDNEFVVVAQHVMEHETRAMLDGQIHDIGRVGATIAKVKAELERQIGQPLTEVCIAAAGRVLKTVTTNIAYQFTEESVVTGEDVHTLDLLGIEKAQDILKEINDTKYKFYCVGYSVVRYYLNDEPFNSLESHKAERISEDIIVTFLPEDVVDGLYAAVGMAGLTVANMTLEPIAAINVAIPENFRLLNIALVDIGAGTSDISVTRDGSIIAYGMIPLAGDEITELIVQHYLVDFKTAEYIKLQSGISKEITYKDIMLIEHTIPSEEVWELAEPVVDKMTTEVAAKIKELNGDKSVSATFIVGGGGKIHGYTEMLADKLDLPQERVALRGEEVLGEVTFEQPDIKKDPLLVTPIGICLNYYDQRNSFIMVRFNGERIKLYDNDKLTIVDAALAAGFPNEDLFPKRGTELKFTVNGVNRIVRGEPGESARVFMNDKPANINTPLEPNSDIIISPSTKGAEATCTLEQLDEYAVSTVTFIVNGRIVRCPKFLEVNGSLELPSYQIKEGDAVDTRSFYTLGQLAEFMDVEVDVDHEMLVNNRAATMETLIYENFTIDWTVLSYGAAAVMPEEYELAETQTAAAAVQADEEVSAAAENAKKAGASGSNMSDADTEKAADENAENKATSDVQEAEKQSADSDENVAGQENAANKEAEESAEAEKSAETSEEQEKAEASEKQEKVKASEKQEEAEASEEQEKAEASEKQEEADDSEKQEEADDSGEQDGADSSEEQEEDASEEQDSSEDSEISQQEKDLAVARMAGGVNLGGPRFAAPVPPKPEPVEVLVYINEEPVHLTGKERYIFVDIFDFYEFDLTASAGRAVVTQLNGANAQFGAELKDGDKIELGWKEI